MKKRQTKKFSGDNCGSSKICHPVNLCNLSTKTESRVDSIINTDNLNTKKNFTLKNHIKNNVLSLAFGNNGFSSNLHALKKLPYSDDTRLSSENNMLTNHNNPSTSRRRKRPSLLQTSDRPDTEKSSQEIDCMSPKKEILPYKKRQSESKSLNFSKIGSSLKNKLNESTNISIGHFCNGNASALGLTKINYDISTDRNTIDKYSRYALESDWSDSGQPSAESPTSKKERVDVIARQCRLHPSNKRYNQGPVANPPPISPGTMVGFSPAGQRHEVDLNAHRPSWFNSEYARMQFDYATRINVSRMIHQLEMGEYLPDTLDPDIERRYFSEKDQVTRESKEHFKTLLNGKEPSELTFADMSELVSSDNEDKDLRLLHTEYQLIKMTEYVNLRLRDFPKEVSKRLQDALNFKITTLMFKKNPIILETLEMLVSKCVHTEVVTAASVLLDKVTALFDTPECMTFKRYFSSEVKFLKEKTNYMTAYDILMMTEEPGTTSTGEIVSLPGIGRNSSKEEDSQQKTELGKKNEDMKTQLQIGSSYSEIGELAEVWIPVQNGDNWIDATNRGSLEDLTTNIIINGGQNESFDSESSTFYSNTSEDEEGRIYLGSVISEE